VRWPTLVAVTVAPTIAAPLGSVTVPVTPALTSWLYPTDEKTTNAAANQ
jgi:hypothetical protein